MSSKEHPISLPSVIVYNVYWCFATRPNNGDPVIGTLLGSVSADDKILISNSYGIEFSHSPDEIDIGPTHKILGSHQNPTPEEGEVIVGWYSMGELIEEDYIHKLYSERVKDPLHLVIDSKKVAAYVFVCPSVGNEQQDAKLEEIPVYLIHKEELIPFDVLNSTNSYESKLLHRIMEEIYDLVEYMVVNRKSPTQGVVSRLLSVIPRKLPPRVTEDVEKNKPHFTWHGKKSFPLLTIKLQRFTGCCWAVVVAEHVTYIFMLQHPKHEFPSIKEYEVSAQELMDMFDYRNKHNLKAGFNYIKSNGATVESRYPYMEEVQTHVKKDDIPEVPRIFLKTFYSLKGMSRDAIKEIITRQPISGRLKSYESFHKWRNQRVSDVYERHDLNADEESGKVKVRNHVVIILGFGQTDETGLEFYHIKNTWGENWGYFGFAKVAMDLITPKFYLGDTGYVDDSYHTGHLTEEFKKKVKRGEIG